MALMAWSDDLSVGIVSIDDQHKKILSMINALNEAMETGNQDDVMLKVFSGLAVYTQKHFAYEEELFAKHGYVESALHKTEHEALLKQVTDLKKKLDAGEARVGVELMQFLKKWLTNHIQKTDKKYTSFLTAKGVK